MIERLRLALTPDAAPLASHEIVVGEGLLPRLADLVGDAADRGPCALVTDGALVETGLPERAAAGLRAGGFDVGIVEVPRGDAAKTLAEAERVWGRFGGMGLERRSPVVAVGGGAVGDLAGFCASAWQRGVPLVQVPTTLLAMADSAIGGKTGVNVPGAKNMIGSFHLAALVVADLDVLTSLPERELRSGFGEVVKCALLAGGAELESLRDRAAALCARDADALAAAVELSARVKLDHVRGDLHDLTGRRALLNLGHTTAHALEASADFGDGLRHGEAVAIGLVVAARISAARGLADETLVDELVGTLAVLGLPAEVPDGTPTAELVALAKRDKKRRAGRHRLVLPRSEGGAVVEDVTDDELTRGIDGSRADAPR